MAVTILGLFRRLPTPTICQRGTNSLRPPSPGHPASALGSDIIGKHGRSRRPGPQEPGDEPGPGEPRVPTPPGQRSGFQVLKEDRAGESVGRI